MSDISVGVDVKIDFRKFVGFMRQKERGAIASTQDPELRRLIYQDIANSGLIFEKGEDTGATKASIRAIKSGGSIMNQPFPNDNGVIRYANGSIDENGIHLDPQDANGRSYGEYSIQNYVNDYTINFGRGSNTTGVYNNIYAIIREHILKGD